MIITLDNAKLGKRYTIYDINIKSKQINRLYELGIIKNSTVIPLFKSMFSDVVAYQIKGSVVALRKKDAGSIKVLS